MRSFIAGADFVERFLIGIDPRHPYFLYSRYSHYFHYSHYFPYFSYFH